MSDLQLIESTLKRASRRRRLVQVWRGFWRGLLAGGSIWLLAFGAYKLFPLPLPLLTAAAAVAGAALVGFVVVAALDRASVPAMARWVDDRQDLKERLSTALEVSGTNAGDWKELVLSDAARHAKAIDPRRLLPLRLPIAARWALLVVILGAGLGFVPEYRTQNFRKKQDDIANIRDTGKQLADVTRRALQQRPPALEPTQKTLESLTELGEQLSKASLTRGEALRDLMSVTDKLNQQAKQLGENPALKPLERAARESSGNSGQSPESLQRQMEAAQKALGNAAADAQKLDKLRNELQKAQDDLANLADNTSATAQAAREQLAKSLAEMGKQMKEMGQDLEGLDEAIKALENNQTDLALQSLQAALTDLDKLRDLAKALKALQQQAAQLGKDLAEQLEKGQARTAQHTLKKMIEQLKGANLSPDQLQKILEEVSRAVEPASEYGKVAQHLKEAVQQMQRGQKPGAAQSLAKASEELEKLLEQMGDVESLLAGLEALERAQMAIATGKSWSECQRGGNCAACQGAGCAKCLGRRWSHGGRPGAGVGTWANEEGWTYWEETGPVDNSGVQRPDMDARGLTDRQANLNPNLRPDKVRGQMSPGGPMPSITLKGVSIKGTSNVRFEEAATTAQQEAQAALNQDQVPRAYQNAVRDYFDDLKK